MISPIYFNQSLYITNQSSNNNSIQILNYTNNTFSFDSYNSDIEFLVFKIVDTPYLNNTLNYYNVSNSNISTQQFNITSPTATYEVELGTGYILTSDNIKIGESFFVSDAYENLTSIDSFNVYYIENNSYTNFNNIITNTGTYQTFDIGPFSYQKNYGYNTYLGTGIGNVTVSVSGTVEIYGSLSGTLASATGTVSGEVSNLNVLSNTNPNIITTVNTIPLYGTISNQEGTKLINGNVSGTGTFTTTDIGLNSTVNSGIISVSGNISGLMGYSITNNVLNGNVNATGTVNGSTTIIETEINNNMYLYCINNNQYLSYNNTDGLIFVSSNPVNFYLNNNGTIIVDNNFYNSIAQLNINFSVPPLFSNSYNIALIPVILFQTNSNYLPFYFDTINNTINTNILSNYDTNQGNLISINQGIIISINNCNCQNYQYCNNSNECINYEVNNYSNQSYTFKKNPFIISKKNIYILIGFISSILLLILIIYIINKL